MVDSPFSSSMFCFKALFSTTFIHDLFVAFSCHRLKTQQENKDMQKSESELSKGGKSHRRRRQLMAPRINDHKLRMGCCAACGRKLLRYEHCCQFDWDHQNPKQKISEISALVGRTSASLARIAEEIGKCLLLCGDCHMLKSRHSKNLSRREEHVFDMLEEGHAKRVNPYDGKNFFVDDEAFLKYQHCVELDEQETDNPDWRYPDDSFLAPLHPKSQTLFSQISLIRSSSSPGLLVGWSPTTGRREYECFLFSHYEGDQKITTGAALVFRNKKRAKGIPYRRVQEDTVRAQMLMAMYHCFRVRHSSPLEKALAAIALSEALVRGMDQLLGRRSRKREAAEEEESHPPKRLAAAVITLP